MPVSNKTCHNLPALDATIIGQDGRVIRHSSGRAPVELRDRRPAAPVKLEPQHPAGWDRLAKVAMWSAIIVFAVVGIPLLLVGGWVLGDLLGHIPHVKNGT